MSFPSISLQHSWYHPTQNQWQSKTGHGYSPLKVTCFSERMGDQFSRKVIFWWPQQQDNVSRKRVSVFGQEPSCVVHHLASPPDMGSEFRMRHRNSPLYLFIEDINKGRMTFTFTPSEKHWQRQWLNTHLASIVVDAKAQIYSFWPPEVLRLQIAFKLFCSKEDMHIP